MTDDQFNELMKELSIQTKILREIRDAIPSESDLFTVESNLEKLIELSDKSHDILGEIQTNTTP